MRFTILTIACLVFVGCQKQEGCTDSAAANYSAEAEVDNGTCQYPGCTDPVADNYDPQANVDDGSCDYPIEGCTDPEANNYNPEASVDDGSCEYLGCTDPEASNYDPQANVDDGSCEYLGCTDPGAVNFDPDADQDDGGCIYLEDIQPTFDGYTYDITWIGNQVWFAENLRTTVYANGDEVPTALSDAEWTATSSGASAIYGEGTSDCSDVSPFDACDDEAQSLATYGRLYNMHAVLDERNVCPSGWHVSTKNDWEELEQYVNDLVPQDYYGDYYSAVVLKTTEGWHCTATNNFNGGNGTNELGFSALPAGERRGPNGNFAEAGKRADFWTSTAYGAGCHAMRLSACDIELDWSSGFSQFGFSVRCVWDGE